MKEQQSEEMSLIVIFQSRFSIAVIGTEPKDLRLSTPFLAYIDNTWLIDLFIDV